MPIDVVNATVIVIVSMRKAQKYAFIALLFDPTPTGE
jgi:hypothetical protein